MKNKFSKNVIVFMIGFIIPCMIVSVQAAISGSLIFYEDHAGLGVSNVQEAVEKLSGKIKKVKIGDYIKVIPSTSSYTIPASETGYSAAQIINPSELKLWRVIDINSSGIEVVSEYTSSTTVSFGQTQSSVSSITVDNPSVVTYAKYIKTLNTIAAQYTDGVHVKSARHMGYDKNVATEEIVDKSLLILERDVFGCNTGQNCSTQENLGGGDLGYLTDYSLVKNVYRNAKAYKYNTTTYDSYWLASRYYKTDESEALYYCGRSVDVDGQMINYDLYYKYSNFTFRSRSFAIRPILTLNSNVIISGGEGTLSNPYTLS